ncbi:hypothetical protein FHE72_20385 [Rossellomorea vietnamensis]|uniref:DUF2254 domain-containing protein n=1 Tax=Rossellomorea vietnamensis TaxID=218284 RepID=A0A6I6UWA4_9BACI|nr:hypothetical protein [Rossellomorea vietnamensis]QHE63100.1 hypothetical protein FHE72_20385 [Rossellomorea vietnamensis]
MIKNINIRYLYTYFAWLKHKVAERFLKKRTVYIFLLIGVGAFILYHLSLPFNASFIPMLITRWIVDLFGIEHIYDKNVRNVITTLISSLTIIISLLSAIYVFTHREQKSVSPSASTDNHKNTLVTIVISMMIFNIVFGCLIIMEYNGLLGEDNYKPSLDITKLLISRITLLSISLVLLILLIDKFIKYLFRTMSVDKMLEDSVVYTSKRVDKLIYTDRSRKKLDSFLNERYRKFHFGLESVFQNLKFAAEHNMNKEFEENIDKFKEVINKLKEDIEKYDIRIASSYLLNNDGAKFTNAYNSALRSNLALISHLMKNHQYTKTKKAVSLYFNMFIESDEKLTKIFKISLNDFLDFIDTNDERQLLIFLEGLDEIPKQHSLITYKFLLMKLINKDQIRNLTNLVYSSNKYIEHPKLKGSTLTILLQNLIKSIEISNYNITGFMVKFLITNFSGKDINRGLLVLKKNRNAYSSVLEAKEKIEGISENGVYAIKINEETFDYCYKKAYILLYAQHIYSIRHDLWYVKKWKETGYEINLSKEFKSCSYSEYMISKIISASNKYGLLFFEDSIAMEIICRELGIVFENKTNVTLPEAVTVLVNKIFKLE